LEKKFSSKEAIVSQTNVNKTSSSKRNLEDSNIEPDVLVQWKDEDTPEIQSHSMNSPKTLEEFKSFYTLPPRTSRIRRKWTEEEEERLLMGIAKYKIGNWKLIKEEFHFPDRTSSDLKDKWRNLHKKNEDLAWTRMAKYIQQQEQKEDDSEKEEKEYDSEKEEKEDDSEEDKKKKRRTTIT